MKTDVQEKAEMLLQDILAEANKKEPRPALQSGKHELLRRIVHLSVPITLIYYLIPPHMWGYMIREDALVVAFIILIIFEAIRIWKKISIPGFRPYEKGRLSAAAWAGIALFISFMLFPMEIVVPSVVAMAIIDPMNGEMRRSRYYPWIPAAFSIVIYFLGLLALSNYSIPAVFMLSITGGLIAMASEIPHLWIDDDFMMIMVPATVLYIIIAVMDVIGVVIT